MKTMILTIIMKNIMILTIIITIGLLPMREHPPSIQISGARATPKSFAGHQDLGFFQVSTLSTNIVMIMITNIILIMITAIIMSFTHQRGNRSRQHRRTGLHHSSASKHGQYHHRGKLQCIHIIIGF